MTKLLKYFKPYIWPLVFLTILTFGQTMANLALPDYMANIVNQGIVGGDSGVIYHFGLIMLLITFAGGLATIGVGYLASKIGTGFSRKIRDALFTKIESFSLVEFNKFSTASLITRSTNDIQQIQRVLIMLLRLALMAPFMGIIAIAKAYSLAPSMSWIMAVSITALVVIIAVIFKIAMPKFKKLQKLVDKLNLVTREMLTGLRVIRSFNKEKYEENKFKEANQELTSVNLFVNRLMVILQPAMMLILNLTVITIVWLGAGQIDAGTLQIGNMLAFMQYAMQAIFAFLMISIIFIMIPRASVSATRIAEVLESETTIKDPKHPIKPKNLGGRIEFKDVAFSYTGSEEPVLQHLSFVAMPGQTTAIVGSTGSGKSTVVNLIPRFYDVTAGQILVDGVDVRAMSQKELRSRIGYISQKAILFSGTIRENIKYGMPNADDKDVMQAAEIAQALEFIEELEEKFESHIAQAGANISGGQKQRLAIARALAKNPEIFIFDDSFSALDFKTDAALRKALQTRIKGKTVLIVAQRISTIMHAEKIVVLDAGKIVGKGTHSELLRNCTVYREIASSQLSEQELANARA
ncbi:MAG: ATP-binding cassette, subfamily multidrug efflux pump [Patescibacteria group bacterium]|nr:ATP-binding cassette, subfamily multidrug efflux pump [Patescibacteria group bacterium]